MAAGSCRSLASSCLPDDDLESGRAQLSERLRSDAIDLHPFLDAVFSSPPTRWRHRVFLNADAGTTPNALLHNLKHNKVLHKQNLFVTVKSHEVPWIKPENVLSWKTWGRTAGRSCCTWASRTTPMCLKHLKLLKSPWGGIGRHGDQLFPVARHRHS